MIYILCLNLYNIHDGRYESETSRGGSVTTESQNIYSSNLKSYKPYCSEWNMWMAIQLNVVLENPFPNSHWGLFPKSRWSLIMARVQVICNASLAISHRSSIFQYMRLRLESFELNKDGLFTEIFDFNHRSYLNLCLKSVIINFRNNLLNFWL